MIQRKQKASILLIGQFSLLALIGLRNGIIAYNLYGVIFQFVAILLLGLAIISMKWQNVRISPLVKEHTELALKGPYKIIRHPMYTSVILFSLSYLFTRFDILNSIMIILLVIILVYKLHFEEKLLTERFPDYIDYKRKTWRLMPFLY